MWKVLCICVTLIFLFSSSDCSKVQIKTKIIGFLPSFVYLHRSDFIATLINNSATNLVKTRYTYLIQHPVGYPGGLIKKKTYECTFLVFIGALCKWHATFQTIRWWISARKASWIVALCLGNWVKKCHLFRPPGESSLLNVNMEFM